MDYVFHGDPDKVNDKLNDIASDKAYSILGPRTLDGVSYACVRTDSDFSIPEGCEVTGPELSAAILGSWFDISAYLASQQAAIAKAEAAPTETAESTAKSMPTETTQEPKKD